MDAQAYQQLVNRMAGRSGSDLESFFDSHGLGDGYRQGYGKKDRINRALTAAREEGTYDMNRHGFGAVFIRAAAPVGVQHSGRPRARQG
jgi:hypothetical protein